MSIIENSEGGEEDKLTNPIHPNLKMMSHSSDDLWAKCNRKYELYKLMPGIKRASDEHLDFGSIVGLGTQELFCNGGDRNKAIFLMFTSWRQMIDSDQGEGSGKTFWHALHALDKFYELINTRLSQYRVATFNGKPASELGFCIDCGNGFLYRGKLDLLLVHKLRNLYFCFEGKTTKNRISGLHEAMFKNSGQALGYSLIIDAIVAAEGGEIGAGYSVLYPVYSTSSMEWEIMEFRKSYTQRANWLRNILLRKKAIAERAEDGYFPMNGSSCYDFFRPCEYFGVCEMMNSSLFVEAKELDMEKEKAAYEFHFTIDELINVQLEKFG